MPVINQVITLAEAFQRNFATWDLELDGFGYLTDEEIYPLRGATTKGLPTVNGIAIGPKSTIDRCLVLWDPQTKITGSAFTIADFMRRLSRHSPLSYPQIGNDERTENRAPYTAFAPITALRFGADPQAFGGIPGSSTSEIDTVRTPTTFVAEGNNQAVDFVAVDNPILHLVLYLTPSLPPPTKRYPLSLIGQRAFTGAEGETLIGGFPIMGRDLITLQFIATGNTFNFRVAGLQCSRSTSQRETTIQTVTGVTALNPAYLSIEKPGVDWLMVWATPTLTSPVTAGAVDVDLRAYDL